MALIDSVLDLLRQGATNLPVPVPWPWTVNYAEWAIFDSIRGALVGLFFIATLIFGPVTLIWIWISKKHYQISPGLVACACLALPYAHCAFSRSDRRCCAPLILDDSQCESIGLEALFNEAITRPLPHHGLVRRYGRVAQARPYS